MYRRDVKYTWGYHSSDAQFVHVSREDGGRTEDLFDVTLYDREVIDATTTRNAEDQSLFDLRLLIGYANAAIKAGLAPERVPDREDEPVHCPECLSAKVSAPDFEGLRDCFECGIWFRT